MDMVKILIICSGHRFIVSSYQTDPEGMTFEICEALAYFASNDDLPFDWADASAVLDALREINDSGDSELFTRR